MDIVPRERADAEPMLILCLKAFGDLVIARTSLRWRGDPAHVAIAFADHLVELDAALTPRAARAFVVAHGERRVPSLFDLRKNGLRLGAASALRLRTALSRLDVPRDTVRVFDQVGARERFITAGAPVRPLPLASNVYHAYAQVLGTSDTTRVAAPLNSRTGARTIGVFPASRIARKNVPLALLTRVVERITTHGFASELFLLDGERRDLEAALPQATIVPRRFAAMMAAVERVDAVMSADSMPAHMAEHAGRPVFVLSPVDNRYWLPRSSFESGHWARFAEAYDGHAALDRFLAGLRAPGSVGE